MDKRINPGLFVLFAGGALLVSLLLQDFYLRSVLNLMAISALLASSLRFVMLMGELNFALAAFTGIGAYCAGYLNTALGVPFGVAVLSAGLVTALASAVFGAITLRAKGPYFLLIGFAFAEAVRVAYSKFDALGGTSGMIGIFPARALDDWMPFIVMSVVVLLLLAFYIAEHSDFGRILFAIRENEDVARSVGINTYLCKVVAISGACFAAGVAGGLHAFVNSVISPGDFSYLLAAFALAYVKVGGEDHFLGPIVGAILLVALSSYALGLGGDEHFLYGGAIIVAVLLMPKGVLGTLGKLRFLGNPFKRGVDANVH
ncbi:branched-chain amino acid ABC transporter permease (plasmid) [Antarctobacter heliothermus]|uniref:Branched-chain amino acid ABC transporter permease n=1 Tax=Antarctobacter heliothermus TaxID=74033 RepID=A0A222EBI6_9RHOB|nr:branched-chain amino acid ABC transporter permease [Antarctobacter heliothermus]ASP23512.1 branched-chain amino acid ABC transporter permease [Antarctobacter heliothermus]